MNVVALDGWLAVRFRLECIPRHTVHLAVNTRWSGDLGQKFDNVRPALQLPTAFSPGGED